MARASGAGTNLARPHLTSTRPLPAPLRLPARAERPDGVIDLGRDGQAVLVEVVTVNFALASIAEQEQLVAGFARAPGALPVSAARASAGRPTAVSGLVPSTVSSAGLA
ncbi:MAG TPA: hypothetical protein VI248_22815 [Kineosporiaceae bacterium]